MWSKFVAPVAGRVLATIATMRLHFVVVLSCATGCGQSSAGSAVFPSTATSLELHVSGGLEPAPGAGSTCRPGDDSYTYTLATQVLSWTECSSPTTDGVYSFTPGQATLDDAAAAQLVDTLQALEPPPQPCGADFSATLVFTLPGGDMTLDAAECLVGYSDMVNAIYNDAP
jgi:hypothetical protein